MSKPWLSGIFPPIPTPFDADGDLALHGLKRNFDHWNQFDLAGYVVLGSNGEGVHLNESETCEVFEAASAEIPPDKLMIAGTGRQSTRETVIWSRRAAESGADAVLVLPPSYYRNQMSREVLAGHYHSVADAAPVPVVIYNMPACTGLDLDLETVVEISAHENIVGIKDSAGDIAKLAGIVQETEPSFSVLAGSAGFLLPALEAGVHGGVLGLANFAPESCLAVLHAFRQGDLEKAQEIQQGLVQPNLAVTKRWGVPAMKAALDMIGLYGGSPRPPLLPLSTASVEELRSILVEAGISSL